MNVVAQIAVVLAGPGACADLRHGKLAVHSRAGVPALPHPCRGCRHGTAVGVQPGWYNLFLAAGAIGGVIAIHAGMVTAGRWDAPFSCACMLGAALVLAGSDRRMLRGALMQGVLPLIALLAAITF